jgi:hypothetical protein
MELRTEICMGGVVARGKTATERNGLYKHDAAYAHALVLAMEFVEREAPGCDPYEVPEIIREHAAELMREWGFDERARS